MRANPLYIRVCRCVRTRSDASRLTENHGVPGSSPGPATREDPLYIGFLRPLERSLLRFCVRVPPNAVGFPRRFREPGATSVGRSSITDTPSARRSGIGARRGRLSEGCGGEAQEVCRLFGVPESEER